MLLYCRALTRLVQQFTVTLLHPICTERIKYATTKMAKKNNLKDVRIREGLNKTELANASGISTRTITRVEEGLRSVAPTTLYKILNGLNKKRSRNLEYTFEEVF